MLTTMMKFDRIESGSHSALHFNACLNKRHVFLILLPNLSLRFTWIWVMCTSWSNWIKWTQRFWSNFQQKIGFGSLNFSQCNARWRQPVHRSEFNLKKCSRMTRLHPFCSLTIKLSVHFKKQLNEMKRQWILIFGMQTNVFFTFHLVTSSRVQHTLHTYTQVQVQT